MSELEKPDRGGPLIATCTLELYQKNIFRVTGLPVDATSKEIARQTQKLQMLEEFGGADSRRHAAFPSAVPPTTDDLRTAMSRMKEAENRFVDELFWYWPEVFGDSGSDEAIQAMLSGETERAVSLWRDREQSGSKAARHNMAVMYHMFAVDWTNFQISNEIDSAQDDQIKSYWRKASERWERMIADQHAWDMLKERARLQDDGVLTDVHVDRLLRQLPAALARVNAEASLILAEQKRHEWVQFHLDVMRMKPQGSDHAERALDHVLEPTRIRVIQHVESSLEKSRRKPGSSADLSTSLLTHCGPMMDMFEQLHGKQSDQRADLFDKVASALHEMLFRYHAATQNDRLFVDLLHRALGLASGVQLREYIARNISIGEGNLKRIVLRPVLIELEDLEKSAKNPAEKLSYLQESILVRFPSLVSQVGADSAVSRELMDRVSVVLGVIATQANSVTRDFETADTALKLAIRLVNNKDVRERIMDVVEFIWKGRQDYTCYFCGVDPSIPEKALQMQLYADVTRTLGKVECRKLAIPIPCCVSCSEIRGQEAGLGRISWLICFVFITMAGCSAKPGIGTVWGLGGGFIFGLIVFLAIKKIQSSRSDLKAPEAYFRVREMTDKGWIIGASPRRTLL